LVGAVVIIWRLRERAEPGGHAERGTAVETHAEVLRCRKGMLIGFGGVRRAPRSTGEADGCALLRRVVEDRGADTGGGDEQPSVCAAQAQAACSRGVSRC
jgi:hypothetical protein